MGVKGFEGRVAVVTGGGAGMGRELVRQLAAAGCHVATCDLDAERLSGTLSQAEAAAADGVRVTTCVTDVTDEAALAAFRDQVTAAHGPHVHLLFNNAGVGGGGSFVADSRDEWERTFDITWGGVYRTTRVFLPLLLDADEGHVVNTSSINGFWASMGTRIPHTAYAAAKFAVKGFTEALIGDFRCHAPHLSASVVMPGHIGTDIFLTTSRMHGGLGDEMTDEQVEVQRARLVAQGFPVADLPADVIRKGIQDFGERFRDHAPTTAAQAATTILDGVLAGQWRILVGEDAHVLDQMVRSEPEAAYTDDFLERIRALGHLGDLIPRSGG